MSRSCESAMPMALRYSSLERKSVSRDHCSSTSPGGRKADWIPDGPGATALSLFIRAVT